MKSPAYHVLLLTISILLLFPGNAHSQIEETLHRFALIVGSNDGGPNRVQLKYAHSDAKSMARVLRQLGGIHPRDTVILQEPDRFDLEAGIARMHNILKNSKQSGTRQELVFYYSGHSDEQGLTLGDDLVSYRELREAIRDLPADVRIAILDSCSSGALTRGKGGTRRAPFLMDTSVNVKGHAFLTSASADEAAQESDKVGGSFFTHYLVSGLRGAADHNRDKKVTLNEAYQYAFHETLARTESTQAGPQHAGYDFQLKGSGDLVLTDLRGTSALIVFAPEMKGRIFIRNRKGQLVAEINKNAGQPMNLGLDPGNYEITLDARGKRMKGLISLNSGQTAKLGLSHLRTAEVEVAVARGKTVMPIQRVLPRLSIKAPPLPPAVPVEKIDGIDLLHQPFRMGIFPRTAIPYSARPESRIVNRAALNFIGMGDYLLGGEVGAISNFRRYDVKGIQIAGIFNFARGDLQGSQLGGIYNYTDGHLDGLQVGGIFSMARGRILGASLSGIFTISTEETWGMRAAGIYNFSGGAVTGATIAGIANVVTGPMKGYEGAGIINVNTRTSHGFQGAGIININGASALGFQGAGIANINADSIWGFQGAGIINVSALGGSTGAQIAGISNWAESMEGAQISGIANIARDKMTGVQIGLVNIAGELKGAQIGLINIAARKAAGASIGIVSYAGNGILAPSFWVSDYSLVNLGLKLGGQHLYGIFGAGVHPLGTKSSYTAFGGFGGHIPFNRGWFDIDVIGHKIFDNDSHFNDIDTMIKLRPTLGFRVINRLSLFAGPTFNTLISTVRDEAGFIPDVFQVPGPNNTNVSLSFGFTAGIQYHPQWGTLNP